MEEDVAAYDPDHPSVTMVGQSAKWGPAGPNILWHQMCLPMAALKYHLDVVLVGLERRMPLMMPCPVVPVIHDLSNMSFSGKYQGFSDYYWAYIMPVLMARVRRAIVVSPKTASEVTTLLPLQNNQVRVVPNGIDHDYFTKQAGPRLCADPYIMYPARVEHPGKNHETLLRAVRLLHDQGGFEYRVVCVGSMWDRHEEVLALQQELGLEDEVLFTGFVDDDALLNYYHYADAMVFPSRFEGFGLPLLEAMASGLPVAASKVDPLTWVGQQAAIYFDCEEPAHMATAMRKIVTDPDLRRQLIDAGNQRVEDFSWSATASQTTALLEQAAGVRAVKGPAGSRCSGLRCPSYESAAAAISGVALMRS